MKHHVSIAIVLLGFAVLPGPEAGAIQAQTISVNDGGWDISGDHAVEVHQGRQALRLDRARAYRRDVRFQDGTIELDVALTGRRSFVYVQFRMQSDGECEEFYLRPHKSELPDAVQYTPVYRRRSNWQLYHGPGSTAAAALPADQWVRVRVVISGRRAAVFVGDVDEPQLIVPRLAREPRPGYLALRGFVPRGSSGPAAHFANLRLLPGHVAFDFKDAEPEPPAPGVVRRWEVSPSFAPADGAVREIPASALAAEGWSSLDAEPSGLLVLGRFRDVPEGARRWAALARLRLTAAEAGPRRFDLGFSDEVSVFLNGTLLFSADDSYSFDAPRRQGLITPDQASVYLPLKKGDNELVLAVTDRFGGWGLMARFESLGGIEIR